MSSFPSSDPSTSPAAFDHAPTASVLLPLLSEAIAQMTLIGEEFSRECQKLGELHARLNEERFHLAVLGQFKRGKSTLLNALLGEDWLPTSVVPLTAIPTFLFPGSTIQARIIYHNGTSPKTVVPRERDELRMLLAQFVTEEGNPQNQHDVNFVEVFHPAPLLHRGVVLIDTPGIGSTFQHNTRTTLNFLSECDAALFVVSADPPLTEVEVGFLKEVRTKVAHLFFVLNKVDYLAPDERQAALAFLEKMLREQVGIEDPGPIFCVSARQGLEARRTHNRQLWEASGMATLEDHLLRFLVSDKASVLQMAVAHKVADLLTDVLMRLRLTIRTLEMPLIDLDERRVLFEKKLAEAERQRLTAQDLLTGDHKRLAAFLEDQAEQLRQEARQYFNQIVQNALQNRCDGAIHEEIAQKALAEAIPVFFERELDELSQTFEQRVNETLASHLQPANALVEALRRGASEIFEINYQPLDHQDVFTFERQPYWVTHPWRTTISPFSPRFIDRFLPGHIQQKRRVARLQEQVEALVLNNVENLRWATRQNLDQAFRRFCSRLDERLRDTGLTIQNAIQSAQKQRQEQAETVSSTVAQLQSIAEILEQLQKQARAFQGPASD